MCIQIKHFRLFVSFFIYPNVRIKIANVRFIRVCFYIIAFLVLRRRNSTYYKPPIKSLFWTLFHAAYPYSELVFFSWFGSSLFKVSEMSGYTHFLHFSRMQTVFCTLTFFSLLAPDLYTLPTFSLFLEFYKRNGAYVVMEERTKTFQTPPT